MRTPAAVVRNGEPSREFRFVRIDGGEMLQTSVRLIPPGRVDEDSGADFR
jgi:hypothetical protein